MADAVTTQIIVDGPHNCIMKFTNISDGTGEAAVTKVDVSTLSGSPTRVGIRRIRGSTLGMGVQILWDATADVLAWYVPADHDSDQDFVHFSNIPNNAGAGVTGDIQFTTVGHTAGDVYTIILEMIKQY